MEAARPHKTHQQNNFVSVVTEAQPWGPKNVCSSL